MAKRWGGAPEMVGALDIRTGDWASVALLSAPLAAVLLFGGSYDLQLLTLAGIYALATLGFQFTFGQAGMLSLAQGAFLGLGAYATGIASANLGLPFLISFPLSIALPVIVAAIVMVPVLRLQSHYFALATLGIAQAVDLTAVNWEDVTGGANGIYGVPGIEVFGLDLSSDQAMAVLVWAIVLVGAGIFRRVTGGLNRLQLATIRDAPLAAGLAGIDSGSWRGVLFLWSAAFGGAAGALQAHTVGVVSPAATGFAVMVTVLTMAVVGGRGSLLGAVLAALLLVHLPEWLRVLETVYLLAYGALLLIVVIVFPKGLAGLAAPFLSRSAPIPLPYEPAALSYEAFSGFEVNGLSKRFGGNQAVQGVSFAIAPGEIVGLIGPNGSGKTTLANLISGIEAADMGTAELNGAVLSGKKTHEIARAGIGRSLQHPEFAVDLTVLETVAAAVHGNKPYECALSALSVFGLEDAVQDPVAKLPPGRRRLVELARVLASGPKVLILDEPAAGLTAGERDLLARVLKDLSARGLGILVIEHRMDFLLPLSDRIICMDRGEIIALGAPEDVRADPAVIAAYFGGGAA